MSKKETLDAYITRANPWDATWNRLYDECEPIYKTNMPRLKRGEITNEQFGALFNGEQLAWLHERKRQIDLGLMFCDMLGLPKEMSGSIHTNINLSDDVKQQLSQAAAGKKVNYE